MTGRRMYICDVVCLDTNAFCNEFAFVNADNVRRERKLTDLPYVKMGGRYFYPLDMCHRYYAGDDVSLELKRLQAEIKKNRKYKVPVDLWFTEV